VVVDDNTFATSGLDDKWLPFDHMATLRLIWPAFFQGRRPIMASPFIALSDQGNADTSTPPSGQLYLQSFLNGAGVTVANGTCADYFLRDVVSFEPVDGADAGMLTSPMDAAAPGDALVEGARD
jgi:hypothetical protein